MPVPEGGFEIPEEFEQAREQAEKMLLELSGVQGVEIGLRERGGKVTDELALRVIVEEKKDMPEGEALPPEFAGVPIDVVERGDVRLLLDLKRYDPLVGGSSGSRCKHGDGESGTLGGVVKVGGSLGMMSNAHVLGTVSAGDKGCSQPEIFTGSCPKDQFGAIVASVWDEFVDVAVTSFNDKRGIKSEIVDIGAVNGTAPALPGMKVRKRGKTTGLTSGVVLTPSGPVPGATETPKGHMLNQIVIKGDGGKAFCDGGDSGSFVVDESGNVVGLLWGATPDGVYAYAIPIDVACKAVGASVATGVSKAGGGNGGGGKQPGKLQSQLFAGDELLQNIADDVGRVRISRTQNSKGPSVGRVQQALLIWDAEALPVHGADEKYGNETATAVRRFKIEELGVPEAEVISDVGPKTVARLDEIALASEDG